MDYELGESMSQLSTASRRTSNSSPTPMGMAKATLVKSLLDYAGPFSGKILLITVDAHSKWIEAQVVSSVTSQSTVNYALEDSLCHSWTA